MALGIGVFDGVHLGHKRIIEELVRQAQMQEAVPAAMTFDPHPRAVLPGVETPPLLVPLEERIRLLHQAGARLILTVQFDANFANLTAEEFLRRLLECPDFGVRGICVGEHWRFGRQGTGNSALLQTYAQRRGLAFAACPELEMSGEIVSSSRVRQAIAAGQLDRAAAMLGRPYRLVGTVEHGFGEASRSLVCPTANLNFKAGVLPPDGVYAAGVAVEGQLYPAAVNVGVSPTFDRAESRRRVEAHLLDYSGNLYDQTLGVEFYGYLRPERRFANPAELKRQIADDIARIQEFFSSKRATEGKLL